MRFTIVVLIKNHFFTFVVFFRLGHLQMRTSEKVLFISVLKVGICCEMSDGSATRSVMLVWGGCLLKQDS